MPTFRSKPKLVEAEQFFVDKPLPFQWRGPYVTFVNGHFFVTTAQAMPVMVRDGDWIVLDDAGPHSPAFAAYPVRADIFERSYEPVDAVEPR